MTPGTLFTVYLVGYLSGLATRAFLDIFKGN